MTLTETWEQLQARGERSGALLKRLPSTAPSDLHIGVAFPSRRPLFVVRVDSPAAARDVEFSTRHVRCWVDEDELAGDRAAAVVIELLDPVHTDIFDTLVSDLAARVGVGLPDEEAVSVLGKRLARWQEMLRQKREGLTLEQQRGLFAELLFLEMLWDAKAGQVASLQSWTGPTGASHDFAHSAIHVEVKARASTHAAVRISSEQQLDINQADRLALLVATIDTSKEGRTLPELVDMLKDRADAEARDLLETRLFEARFMDHHRDRYSGNHWEVRDMSAFRVGDGFPRLVPAVLPDGVKEVSYLLVVASLAEHAEDLDDVVRTSARAGSHE